MGRTSRTPRRLTAASIGVAWLALGCASIGGGGGSSRSLGNEIRPDAPAEYDVLVAQQHEVDGRAAEALAAYQRAVAKDDQSAYVHRKLAEALARNNRLAEALKHAQRAHELEPDDVPTRLFLGQLYRLQRDPAAAEPILRGEDGEPLDDNAAFVLYQIYLETNRLDAALDTARWLAERKPDSTRARLAVANAYQRMDRPLDAERELRRALDDAPGNLQIQLSLARSLRGRGEREAEIAVYREALEYNPHHHGTLVALAEALVAIEDTEGAIATFEEIERFYPEDLRSLVRLAFLQYEARDYGEAAKRFQRALELSPGEHEIAFFLGIVLRRMGDEQGAIAAFEGIPERHPQYAEARTQLAAILERRGEYPEALAEVERAASSKPTRALDLYAATLRSKAGDFDGAVAHLEKLLNAEPGDDELLYNLGVVYGESDRTDEALDYMQRALEENPDNASALNYIGYTWAEKGIRLDEAEQLIARAIELRPEDGYIVDSLGWVYYMRAVPLVESGRREEARVHLDRALEELQKADELTGGDPVVSEHIGDTYLLMGDKPRALERYEEAMRLEPRLDEQPELHQKLENLRRELGGSAATH